MVGIESSVRMEMAGVNEQEVRDWTFESTEQGLSTPHC